MSIHTTCTVHARTIHSWAFKGSPIQQDRHLNIVHLSTSEVAKVSPPAAQRACTTGPGKLLSVEEVHEEAGLTKCSPLLHSKRLCSIEKHSINWRLEYNKVALLRCHHLHWVRGHCLVFECPNVHRRCRFSLSALLRAHDAQMHHEPEVPLHGKHH